MSRLLLVVSTFVALCSSAAGQTATGIIQGRVSDASGGNLNWPRSSVRSTVPPDCTLRREKPPGINSSRAPGETRPTSAFGTGWLGRALEGHGVPAVGLYRLGIRREC